MSSSNHKFLEDRFFERCKEVYKKAKQSLKMDDWDAGFDVGNVFAVEEILLAAMAREAVKKQFEEWDKEIENEVQQNNKSG